MGKFGNVQAPREDVRSVSANRRRQDSVARVTETTQHAVTVKYVMPYG